MNIKNQHNKMHRCINIAKFIYFYNRLYRLPDYIYCSKKHVNTNVKLIWTINLMSLFLNKPAKLCS